MDIKTLEYIQKIGENSNAFAGINVKSLNVVVYTKGKEYAQKLNPNMQFFSPIPNKALGEITLNEHSPLELFGAVCYCHLLTRFLSTNSIAHDKKVEDERLIELFNQALETESEKGEDLKAFVSKVGFGPSYEGILEYSQAKMFFEYFPEKKRAKIFKNIAKTIKVEKEKDTGLSK